MSERIFRDLVPIIQTKSPKVDPNTLTGQEELRSFGIDSLDFLEMVHKIETHFQVTLSITALEKINTIQDLITVIDHASTTKRP